MTSCERISFIIHSVLNETAAVTGDLPILTPVYSGRVGDPPILSRTGIARDPIMPAVKMVCNGELYIKVNRPGDPPPRTGSIGGRSSHQDRPHSGAVGSKSPKMGREPHALISTSLAAAAPDKRRTERLSLRAAIFWIGVLSLAGWSAIIALALALL